MWKNSDLYLNLCIKNVSHFKGKFRLTRPYGEEGLRSYVYRQSHLSEFSGENISAKYE